jgi:hypothetical protein
VRILGGCPTFLCDEEVVEEELYFVGVLSVCAFVLPGVASAASWFVDPGGTFPATAVLDSSNPNARLSFSFGSGLNFGATCAVAQSMSTFGRPRMLVSVVRGSRTAWERAGRPNGL